MFSKLSIILSLYTLSKGALVTQIQDGDYNDERLSIDFDASCLGNEDPQDEITQILDLFPCLSQFTRHGIPLYFYNKKDKISRVYLDINDGGSCLDDHELNWNYYCIYDIRYEEVITIGEIVSSQKTNAIYYDGVLKNTPWQLDFLDSIETDNIYKFYNGIAHNNGDDREIDIWILDTGVNGNHKEFTPGQVIDEYDNFTQGHAHGTGTAGCAGGNNYGIARGFKIHDYPVCQYGGSCGSADIFAGLYKVLAYLQNNKGRRSVINMSLGSGVSDSTFFTNIFDEIINAGGIVVVASGNWGDDACTHNYSFYYKLVISVGSHDSSKVRASTSSYGTCVHIYQPGVGVSTSYSYTDNTTVQAKSGTSFASPILAGRIANMLHENPTLSRDEILYTIQNTNLYPISSCPSGYCYGSYYIAPTTVGQYLKYEAQHLISLSTTISKSGISGTVFVDASATIHGFSCRVDATHNNRSNLNIYLQSPQGTKVLLASSISYDNEANIHITYFNSNFDNQNMYGLWTLTVYDRIGKYAGRVDYWNLKFYTKSTVQMITTTTTSTPKTCSCKGSRKCTTGFTTESECLSYSTCYWSCI